MYFTSSISVLFESEIQAKGKVIKEIVLLLSVSQKVIISPISNKIIFRITKEWKGRRDISDE